MLVQDMPANFLCAANQHPRNIPVIPPTRNAATDFNERADHFYRFTPPNTVGRISVHVKEAKLTKNYGLVSMDPYCRIRVGTAEFQSNVCNSGGKNPQWDRVFNFYLGTGVDSVYIEIIDEKQFTEDQVIAYAHIVLPNGVFHGEKIDEWYPLSGKQGENMEGLVNCEISLIPCEQTTQAIPVEEYQQATLPPLFNPEDLEDLKSMFPQIDEDLMKDILIEKGGDKAIAASILIEMAD
uniref:CUE domain-containing protein n=1 Tax=Rhabditophanes sp. KR3021 TaxID=114890 RepID=A0AC35UBZ6_9BILA